jgi:hypothetical protein
MKGVLRGFLIRSRRGRIPTAPCRDKAAFFAFTPQSGIAGDGRGVRQNGATGRVDTIFLLSAADSRYHPLAEISGRGQYLGNPDPSAIFLHHRHVGERAAYVDADAPSHALRSLLAYRMVSPAPG